ncbi:hypothetical protein [Escherichia phage TM1]|uniref:Uncharacterized protein n=1 Tax=Escherichia phage TM1 TaxID=2762279 RepID=A0ABY4XT95_9CAUD|nr:hypothetical protein [Escherichia phage TM1]
MKIPESLKELVLEMGRCEKVHRKYAEFCAYWSYILTEKDVESYAESPSEAYEWRPFIGLTIVASGMWNDSYGSEVIDWDVYRPVEKETEMSSNFWSLMSHLNSEDNDMAHEFANKWLKPEVTLERIEELKVSLMPATVAMATGGLDDGF